MQAHPFAPESQRSSIKSHIKIKCRLASVGLARSSIAQAWVPSSRFASGVSLWLAKVGCQTYLLRRTLIFDE